MKFISFLNKNKYFILFLLFGLLILTYPMLISNFDLMPGNGMDSKSISYIMEHSYQWLLGTAKHEHFWTAPFYYPYQNNIAFSDSLMGIDPIYWILRIFFEPLSAFQAVMVAMSVLNYATLYYLFKKVFKFSSLASCSGSFIFAFGLLRLFRSVHLNYYSQFYTILGLIFLFKVNKNNSVLKNNIYLFLSALSIAMQFYSCYTLGWGFCVLFFFGILFSLIFKDTREKIFDFLKDFYKLLIIYFLVFIALLTPFAIIYLDLNIVRTMDDVIVYLQDQFCWIRNVSRLDNLFIKDVQFVNFWERDEITASSGIFTTIISLVGLWFSGKIAKVKSLKWSCYFVLTLVFFMTCTVGTFFLWEYLYNIIPGIQGIRAIIRISFIGLIVISFGVTCFVQNFQENKLKNKIILILSIFIVLIEQIPHYIDPNSYWITYGWSKSVFKKQIAREVKQIKDGYDVLLFNLTLTPQDESAYNYFSAEKLKNQDYMISASVQALAMWTALYKNLYCMNGLSGVGKAMLPIDSKLKVYQKNIEFDFVKFNDRKYLLEDKTD